MNAFRIQYLQYFSKRPGHLEQLLSLKLQELFLLLLSSPDKDSVVQFICSASAGTAIDIEYIIKEHLFRPLTIEELARLSGRSLASFKRDFKKIYDSSPKHWINQQRLQYAHRLILYSNKNVAEIAYESGYENVSHFIKLFKKRIRNHACNFQSRKSDYMSFLNYTTAIFGK